VGSPLGVKSTVIQECGKSCSRSPRHPQTSAQVQQVIWTLRELTQKSSPVTRTQRFTASLIKNESEPCKSTVGAFELVWQTWELGLGPCPVPNLAEFSRKCVQYLKGLLSSPEILRHQIRRTGKDPPEEATTPSTNQETSWA
jgi:hypothetical protein